MKNSTIPFFNFLDAPDSLRLEWREAIHEVIESGRFIGGDVLIDFEAKWANYIGAEFAIGVANGLDSITLALRALDIGSGKKVAVPAHTFIATWLAVAAVGAQPIGIDCDSNGLIDIDDLRNLREKVDAVIPVHMHGLMVDMEELNNWAKPRGIKVIEDCAQAHGAELHGRKAGNWGDVGAFSFYPTKNLGALGDAGAVVTSDTNIASTVRSLANYGSLPEDKYSYKLLGVNSRLDPIQAAVLSVNLSYLDTWNMRRKNIANQYLEVCKKFRISTLNSSPESVWHHFVLLSENPDLTIAKLKSHGISTDRHYPSSAASNFYSISKKVEQDFPMASMIARKTLSIPISPWMSDKTVKSVLHGLSDESLLKTLL